VIAEMPTSEQSHRVSKDQWISISLDGQLAYLAPPRTRQPRGSVLVRWLLALPYLLVALFMTTAVAITWPVAWLIACLTQRNVFAQPYVQYLEFMARVGQFHTLLSAHAPRLSLHSSNAANVVATEAVLLTPRALASRLVLVPFALFVSTVMQIGRTVVLLACWPVAVVTGQLPLSVFDAVRSMERYYLRTLSYVIMVQRDYPRDLLGERIVDPHSLSLLEALAVGTSRIPGEMSRRARVVSAVRTRWPVRISSASRRVVLASVLIGSIVTIAARAEYDVLVRPPHYSQAWSNSYFIKLRSGIDLAVLAESPTSSVVTWADVHQQCDVARRSLAFLHRAAQYPNGAQNRLLQSSVRSTRVALGECLRASAVHDTALLHRADANLALSTNELIAFFNEIVQPGEL
jgi:hypothetical protein